MGVGWGCAGTSRGSHAALLARNRAARPAWSRLRTRKVDAGHDQICGRGKKEKNNPSEAEGQHGNQHGGLIMGFRTYLRSGSCC